MALLAIIIKWQGGSTSDNCKTIIKLYSWYIHFQHNPMTTHFNSYNIKWTWVLIMNKCFGNNYNQTQWVAYSIQISNFFLFGNKWLVDFLNNWFNRKRYAIQSIIIGRSILFCSFYVFLFFTLNYIFVAYMLGIIILFYIYIFRLCSWTEIYFPDFKAWLNHPNELTPN